MYAAVGLTVLVGVGTVTYPRDREHRAVVDAVENSRPVAQGQPITEADLRAAAVQNQVTQLIKQSEGGSTSVNEYDGIFVAFMEAHSEEILAEDVIRMSAASKGNSDWIICDFVTREKSRLSIRELDLLMRAAPNPNTRLYISGMIQEKIKG